MATECIWHVARRIRQSGTRMQARTCEPCTSGRSGERHHGCKPGLSNLKRAKCAATCMPMCKRADHAIAHMLGNMLDNSPVRRTVPYTHNLAVLDAIIWPDASGPRIKALSLSLIFLHGRRSPGCKVLQRKRLQLTVPSVGILDWCRMIPHRQRTVAHGVPSQACTSMWQRNTLQRNRLANGWAS
jgi:hypothetical protein